LNQRKKIRAGKETEEKVLEKSKKVLNKIMDKFKDHEKQIGEELGKAQRETRDELSTLGPCPVCKKGLLQLRRGKFGMFIACNQYPDCKTTFGIPANALCKPADKILRKIKSSITNLSTAWVQTKTLFRKLDETDYNLKDITNKLSASLKAIHEILSKDFKKEEK